MTFKIGNNSKLIKEQKMFANWTIDGAQQIFNKNGINIHTSQIYKYRFYDLKVHF